MPNSQRLTPQQALQKSRQFCDYQERCHQEVREKLFGFGLATADVDTIIGQLIEENLLNEERFAQSFARGKFRMKHWGRHRIKQELKSRRVSDYCIKLAMQQIDPEDYSKTLLRQAEKKWDYYKTAKPLQLRVMKTKQALQRLGYESDLILYAMEIIRQSTTA